jgi:c-di-GMP-binding flagellar brake protein YcgR
MQDVYKAETNAENRRFPRLQLKLWVHYQLLRQGEVSTQQESLAQDLGARGMAIRSDHAVRVGQLLKTTLYLPPEDNRRRPDKLPIYSEKESLPVDILARVVWCQRAENQEYMLGIEFLDPEPAHRSRLKAFLIDYKLDQPDSALYT